MTWKYFAFMTLASNYIYIYIHIYIYIYIYVLYRFLLVHTVYSYNASSVTRTFYIVHCTYIPLTCTSRHLTRYPQHWRNGFCYFRKYVIIWTIYVLTENDVWMYMFSIAYPHCQYTWCTVFSTYIHVHTCTNEQGTVFSCIFEVDSFIPSNYSCQA